MLYTPTYVMNKVTLSVVGVILCIAIFTVAIISLSNNNSNNNTPMPTSTPSPTPSPTPNVKITNFIYLGNWHGTTLGGMLDLFSLNYTNLGMTDVENLTVTLNTNKTNAKETDPQHPTPTPISGYNPYYYLDETINGETYLLESLKAGETKNFEKSYFDVGFLLVEPFALTITLKFNDTILDQATIMIPLTYLSSQ
ncbi:MAG: hypothetical protein IAX22_07820 [Candidatus Bathyarchaeota archaeon]|nr:hypothetical protein [Candidatus Bathyarchaeota archaeon]